MTLKSSTIFIATAKENSVYRSVEEVPPRLRKKLVETTSGLNSATILIADRAGREQIMRAVRGLPSQVASRLASRNDAAQPRPAFRFHWRHWAEILIPGLIGMAAWLLFTAR
jgi:hypothetical protein